METVLGVLLWNMSYIYVLFVLPIRVFRLVFLHPFQAMVPELQILGISELSWKDFSVRRCL